MADLITQASKPMTDAEYQCALVLCIADTQHLIDGMQLEQTEIERLKQKSILRDSEISTLKMQTQEILSRLEMMI